MLASIALRADCSWLVVLESVVTSMSDPLALLVGGVRRLYRRQHLRRHHVNTKILAQVAMVEVAEVHIALDHRSDRVVPAVEQVGIAGRGERRAATASLA